MFKLSGLNCWRIAATHPWWEKFALFWDCINQMKGMSRNLEFRRLSTRGFCYRFWQNNFVIDSILLLSRYNISMVSILSPIISEKRILVGLVLVLIYSVLSLTSSGDSPTACFGSVPYLISPSSAGQADSFCLSPRWDGWLSYQQLRPFHCHRLPVFAGVSTPSENLWWDSKRFSDRACALFDRFSYNTCESHGQFAQLRLLVPHGESSILDWAIDKKSFPFRSPDLPWKSQNVCFGERRCDELIK
jgi:hypothetical protein